MKARISTLSEKHNSFLIKQEKNMKTFLIMMLVLLTACSAPSRKIAQDNSITLLDPSVKFEVVKNKTETMMENIFHAYLYGHIQLKKFDQELTQKKHKFSLLKSRNYSRLLALRSLVDEMEEKLIDLYISYVVVNAHPKYDEAQKTESRIILKTMDEFMGGLVKEEKIPEPLIPMILSNIREKQTEIDDELKRLEADEAFTGGDETVIAAIHDARKQVRAGRMKNYKTIKAFKVDEAVFAETIKHESKKESYRNLINKVEALSKEMEMMMPKESNSREINQEVPLKIFPSVTAAGNVSGTGYPANTWSITYDDGPAAATTPTVLKNLLEKKVKATFFQLAKQVVALPTISKSIKDAGMDIASHSYTHAQLTKVGAVQLEKEIGTAKKTIEEKLGTEVKLFRLPYGAGVSVASIRQKIADHKLIHVFWTVDTLDWQDKNPDSIVERAKKQMSASKKYSGIILFHDIHSQSVIASNKLIEFIAGKKNRICTVQEVVDEINSGKAICQ